MSNQSSENYLDQLLNAVNATESQEHKEETQNESQEYESMLEDFVSEHDSAEEVIPEDIPEVPEDVLVAKSEDDFIREFENELSDSEYLDLLNNFEEEIGVDRRENPDLEGFYRGEGLDTDDDFYRGFDKDEFAKKKSQEEMLESVDDVLQKVAEDMSDGFEEPLMEEEPQMKEEPLGEMSIEELMMSEGVMEEIPEAMPDMSMDTSDGEMDISNMGEDDLMSLLANSDEFGDLGDLLSMDENNEQVEGIDVFASFADGELEQQMVDSSEDTSSDNKKSAKGGFLGGLFAKLFGSKDNDSVTLSSGKGVDAGTLSEENDMILKEFDKAEGAAKKKKDKPKKEKKQKEPKPKKEKAPKAPKPKKEKKPKEVDNTPPLPKKPVMLIWLMVISLFALVFIGTNLFSYNSAINEAKEYYASGNYADAYKAIGKMSVKKQDEELFNKIVALAPADAEWDSYRLFLEEEDHIRALDSLISAAGRCDINAKYAVIYDCVSELDHVKEKISNELKEQYGMTYEEALEMYDIYDRDDYTLALYEKIEELGLQ